MDILHKAYNFARRVFHGLPLHGESVWAGAPTDLFLAHLSIYDHCSTDVAGLDVLDAGCGTGYGSAYLLKRGARGVVGVDRDRQSIRYASKRYSAPGLEYVRGDLQKLVEVFDTPRRFDRIVASNVVEHLPEPERFLDSAGELLTKDGALWIVVPAIVDDNSMKSNQRNPYHVSNLYVAEWEELFIAHGFDGTMYRQVFVDSQPDFSSSTPSTLDLSAFQVQPTCLDEVYREPCLGVLFRLEIDSSA